MGIKISLFFAIKSSRITYILIPFKLSTLFQLLYGSQCVATIVENEVELSKHHHLQQIVSMKEIPLMEKKFLKEYCKDREMREVSNS